MASLSRDNGLSMINSNNVPIVQAADISCAIIDTMSTLTIEVRGKVLTILEELRADKFVEVKPLRLAA